MTLEPLHQDLPRKVLTTAVAIMAMVGFLTVAGVAKAQADDGSTRFPFVVTEGFYGGADDLIAAIEAEFGPDAEIADWTEIKERYGASLLLIDLFARRLDLEWNEHLWVTVEGERVFPGAGLLGEPGRTRYYFLSRWDQAKPENYEAHDQILDNFLSLGSWYDFSWQILVKLNR